MDTITPITSLSDTLLELTEEKISKEKIRNGLGTVSSTSKELLAFVDSYCKFTHIPTPGPTLFCLKDFISHMVELARRRHPGVPVTFHASIIPNDLILHAGENLISQVIISLLKNAVQTFEKSSPPTEEKHIHMRTYCDEARAVLVEISNNGPAIPPNITEHIFISFFITRENGGEIGLSISRQVIRLSDGSLSLKPGEEITFVLKFN